MAKKIILSSVRELDKIVTELEEAGHSELVAEVEKIASDLMKQADFNEAKDYLRIAIADLPHVVKALDKAYIEMNDAGLEREGRKVYDMAHKLETFVDDLKGYAAKLKHDTTEEGIFKKKKKSPGFLEKLKQKLAPA